MKDNNKYYNLEVKEVIEELETSINGLSESEAKKRLEKYGKNELAGKKSTPLWVLFLNQFKDVLVILLLVAAVLSILINNYVDGTIMFMIAFINSVIGFFQEYKAEKIMESLNELIKSPSKVIRDKKLSKIDQSELVVGDIVSLEEGDKIPADLRLIECFNLRLVEVSLTGESMPQEKHSNHIEGNLALGDRDNMAFLGTNVASGSAKGVVIATGMNTEMGEIALMTQEEDISKSPLQKELGSVANKVALFAVVIGFTLFGISVYRGLGMNFAIIYGLGIAVAVVPQALPMQTTVALSQGVDRLSKENAVVKKLASVETLGSTNVIATDKTGTLTKNEMTVRKVWFNNNEYDITGLGYKPEGDILNSEGIKLTESEIKELEILFDSATMASNAEIHGPDEKHSGWYPIGDPTEAALITLSTKLGTRSPNEDEENPELHEFSFDSERKRMSSIRQFDNDKVLTMKGAMDSVLSISKYIYKDGKKVEITEEDKDKLNKLNEKYSKKALRVLAIAYRELNDDLTDYTIEEVEKDVVLLGLVAMIDPPKEGVREAIEKSHKAHIDTYIMTGDHSITAQAIGKEIKLSIDDKDVLVFTSKDLEEMTDEELGKIMNNNRSLIFSRVSPKDKLRIVKLLKGQNKIVAVTGDGVNDAPALKSAHIGVAMGQMGTDVTKEAADLILLDDSFPTLVHAIREGRTIYNNLKKTIIASLTSNAAELAIVLIGLVLGAVFNWPIPILAIQILSIDLLAEILPLTALTFDKSSKELMSSPPRRQENHIVNKNSFAEIIFFGLLMGGLAYINFGIFVTNKGVGAINMSEHLYRQATTISFLTIVITQWINIMSRRYELRSIFDKNFFYNKSILYSILISIVAVLFVTHIPGVNTFLGYSNISFNSWITIFVAGLLFLMTHEILKLLKRKKIKE
ncbi:MAG: cation-translocating P-type ATPase [Bacillota bacterium]|nr:cation-translocating P-type ATPase [Bacillota bacterium]